MTDRYPGYFAPTNPTTVDDLPVVSINQDINGTLLEKNADLDRLRIDLEYMTIDLEAGKTYNLNFDIYEESPLLDELYRSIYLQVYAPFEDPSEASAGNLSDDVIERERSSGSAVGDWNDGILTIAPETSGRHIIEIDHAADSYREFLDQGQYDGVQYSFTITPANQAPVAVADVFGELEMTGIQIVNLFDNDIDPDGDTITFETFGANSFDVLPASTSDTLTSADGWFESGYPGFYLNTDGSLAADFNTPETAQNSAIIDNQFNINYTVTDGISTSEKAVATLNFLEPVTDTEETPVSDEEPSEPISPTPSTPDSSSASSQTSVTSSSTAPEPEIVTTSDSTDIPDPIIENQNPIDLPDNTTQQQLVPLLGIERVTKLSNLNIRENGPLIVDGFSFDGDPLTKNTRNRKRLRKLARTDVDFIFNRDNNKLYWNANGLDRGLALDADGVKIGGVIAKIDFDEDMNRFSPIDIVTASDIM